MIFKGEFIFNDEYLGNLVFDNKGLLRERERDLKVIVSGIYVFLLVIKVGILGGC